MINNIELYIEGKAMDLSDDMDITLSKSFEEDEESFEIVESEYSYEFTLPSTYNNRQVFGFVETFDVPSKFDKLYEAQLYANGLLVLNGNLLINKVDDDGYSVNLYVPAQVSMEELFDGMTLRQIEPHYKGLNTIEDINDINTYVLADARSRWDGPSGFDTADPYKQMQYDRHICFPYLLYGPTYNTNDDMASNVQDMKDNLLNMNNIYPSFNVLSVIKDIFKTKGYNVGGNIFNDTRFKGLYETYSADDADFYKETKETPYFLSFKGSYNILRDGNISSTARRDDLFANETYSFYRGWDSMLLSENTKIEDIDNDYGMLNRGSEGGYVITIPKSGWYQIKCSGNFGLLNDDTDIIRTEEGKVNIGFGSRFDEATLNRQPVEVIIKKGIPLQNNRFYTMFSSVPCMPTYYVKDDTIFHDNNIVYLRCENNSRQNYYPKNGCTEYIKEIGDEDVSDLIVGARFGGNYNYDDVNMNGDRGYRSFGKNTRYEKMVHSVLPTTRQPIFRTFDEKKYLRLYELRRGTNTYPTVISDNTYGYNTAVAFALENKGYFNFDGYNKIDIDNAVWDTTSNFKKVTYKGQQASNAVSLNNKEGKYNLANCIWLEEGEEISIELSIPATWYGGVSDGAIALRHIYNKFDFMMGYVSSDEEWKPSAEMPIPSDEELRQKKSTNVNLLLPETDCNDYVDNFLRTFNLRLTRKSENEFSIDNSIYSDEYNNNIIDLEPYFNVQKASFSRLDLPTKKTLKWTIDVDEEGYVNGAIALNNPLNAVEPRYDGSITYENKSNTTENEVAITSDWSYCWFKEITFEYEGSAVYRYNVPVICTYKEWDKSPSSAYSDGIDPNKTPRLIYINPNNVINMSNEDKVYKMLMADNYYEGFLIDYNRPTEKVEYKNISDIFFRVNLSSQYKIDLPMILPNKVYNDIGKNTLVKVNDGLYRVLQIDGHSIGEDSESTVSLISLK